VLPDATLAELHAVWPDLADDMRHAHLMPDDIAEQVISDFTEIRDELLRRQRMCKLAVPLCSGHDGTMLRLEPPHD